MRIMEEYIIYAEGVKREIQDKFDTLMKKCTRNYKSGALGRLVQGKYFLSQGYGDETLWEM